MMNHRYLEVTFRDGRPIAAYFYLPRRPGDVSTRTQRCGHGLIIDFAADGRPIGIEITAPTKLRLADFNEALIAAHQQPASNAELAPLAA